MMRSFQSLFAFLQSYHLLSKMLAIVTTLIIKPKLSKRHKKFFDKKATSWTAWTRARSQKRCQYINLQAAPLYRIPNHSWYLQKRVLFKIKSFQQFIENSPPTVKHVCLPKYKSNFVWFWVPTWFFFESEQCHGLQKGHIARAKLPCCRVATLDSILNLIFSTVILVDYSFSDLLFPGM